MLSIAIVGCVSSGKTSLLNAIAGGFLAPASKDRQTYDITTYRFRVSGGMKQMHKIAKDINKNRENNISRFDNIKVNTQYKPQRINCKDEIPAAFNVNITDYPGLGDAGDLKDVIMEALLDDIGDNNYNIILFITDANRAMLQSVEISYLKQIRKGCEKVKDAYGYCPEIVTVLSKFDTIDDIELCGIFDKVKKIEDIDKCFRVCAYQYFLYNVKEYVYLPKSHIQEVKNILKHWYGNRAPILSTYDDVIQAHKIFKSRPTEDISGDWDDLIGYMMNYSKDIDGHRKIQIKEYFANYNIFDKIQTNSSSYHKDEYISVAIMLIQEMLHDLDMSSYISEIIDGLKTNLENVNKYKNTAEYIIVAEFVAKALFPFKNTLDLRPISNNKNISTRYINAFKLEKKNTISEENIIYIENVETDLLIPIFNHIMHENKFENHSKDIQKLFKDRFPREVHAAGVSLGYFYLLIINNKLNDYIAPMNPLVRKNVKMIAYTSIKSDKKSIPGYTLFNPKGVTNYYINIDYDRIKKEIESGPYPDLEI